MPNKVGTWPNHHPSTEIDKQAEKKYCKAEANIYISINNVKQCVSVYLTVFPCVLCFQNIQRNLY